MLHYGQSFLSEEHPHALRYVPLSSRESYLPGYSSVLIADCHIDNVQAGVSCSPRLFIPRLSRSSCAHNHTTTTYKKSSLWVFLADHNQRNLSSVSAIIGRRTSSIVFLPKIPSEPDPSEVQYLTLLPTHRISPTFVPYLAIVLRSMSFRPRTATSSEYTVCPTRREKSRKAILLTLARDR